MRCVQPYRIVSVFGLLLKKISSLQKINKTLPVQLLRCLLFMIKNFFHFKLTLSISVFDLDFYLFYIFSSFTCPTVLRYGVLFISGFGD